MIQRVREKVLRISFELNGRPVGAAVDRDLSLMDLLRDRFGITSPKNGCQPQAQCGCCTVWVNDRPRLSCVWPARKVDGKRVVTCEGLPDDVRQQVVDCFLYAGGVQCGFCTPGIVMTAAALVNANPNPTRKEIAASLRGHLCRCTGYVKIIDAIELYAAVRRGERLPEPDRSGRVGTSLQKHDARRTVLGERAYVADLTFDGMQFAAPRLSDHPRALLRAIDTCRAGTMPGVKRILTAADVPGDRYVGLIKPDWPVLVAVGEETRYVGDMIALVMANSMDAARKAAAAIHVDYQVREPVTDPRQALAPDAPKVHTGGNLLSRSVIARGDVDAALAKSAHVVEETFRTQRVEHLYLEPEACVARPDGDGGLVVCSMGQGVFDDRRQIASVLAWNPDRVKVELVPNGGAFGGKEDMGVQAQTALAAHLCNAPVQMVLTREESFRVHPKRHPMELEYTIGCDDAGRLTALRARIIGDTGAYASVGAKVLERSAGHAAGPYRVPNLDVEALAVYTNNPPSGAMRGFGVNQSAFAIEGCLDRLADEVGIDRWEIRWRNALDAGDVFATGQRLDKPFGLKKTLLAVKDPFRQAKYAGIACGIKNVGIGNGLPDMGKAALRVENDRTITIRTGYTEMGQGLHTVCIQMACHQTHLPPELFRSVTDTRVDLDCGQTTASRATVLAGNAVLDAARKLKADLDAGRSLTELAGTEYRGEYACTYTTRLGANVPDPKTHLTYGYATQVVILNDDGTLKKVIAAHDVGRAVNPKLLAGQIEGAIHMGLGYALTEDFVVEGGYLKSKDIQACGVLRAHHMPEVETLFIEEPDPECPYGARGVGEIGLVPTAAAVAGALFAFDGTRRTQLPMSDSPAARAIRDPRWKHT